MASRTSSPQAAESPVEELSQKARLDELGRAERRRLADQEAAEAKSEAEELTAARRAQRNARAEAQMIVSEEVAGSAAGVRRPP
jgi:hypothetical protein